MTTTLSPAKCKAFLAKLKEHILDAAEESSSVTAAAASASSGKRSSHARALLAMEMLQRGVLLMDSASVFYEESSSDAADDKKSKIVDNNNMTAVILNAIADCAGKTLLQESSSPSLPKPLLAGSAAMAGRVAQIIAAASTNEDYVNDVDMLTVDTRNLLESTRQRCLQVQDDRLLVMLNLLFPPSSSSNSGEDDNEGSVREQAIMSFLAVAEGYFYRAASFQPDAPPTWKRAWDVVVERNQLLQQQHQHTATCTTTTAASWEAIPALTQLRRIAFAKNNASRASELALVLVSSYLECPPPLPPLTEEENKYDGKVKNNKSSLFQQTLHAFVRPIIISMKLEPAASRRSDAIRQAAQILMCEVASPSQPQQDSDDDDSNSLLTLCLRVQVALSMEQDVFIQERAQQLHQAALRRRDMATVATNSKTKGKGGGGVSKASAASTTSVAVLTLEAARERAQQEYAWKTAMISATTMTDGGSPTSNADFDFDSADYQVVAGLKASAVALRDALLEETSKHEDSKRRNQEYKSLACSMLNWYLQCQKQQARAFALVCQQKLVKKSTTHSAAATLKVVDDVWRAIRKFVEPVLQSYHSILALPPQAEAGKHNQDDLLSFTEAESGLVETSALLVPCTFWMLTSSNSGDGDGTDSMAHHVAMLQATYQILSALLKKATSQWDSAKALAGPMISGTSSTYSSLLAQQVVTLTCALVSTRCWLAFFDIHPPLESKSSNILATLARLQSATATGSSSGDKNVKKDTSRQGEQHQDQSIAQSSAEYGTHFLACLISWSGLYQDAWKSCSTLPQVRRLVQCARQTLEMATSQWGRQCHPRKQSHQMTLSADEMLLDLAQADAESSFGVEGGDGGFSATLAQRLYHQVLACTPSQNDESSSPSLSSQLVRAHCYSGLAKLLVSTFGTRDAAASQSSSATTVADHFEGLHRAEALARQSLGILMALSKPQDGPLFLWKVGAGGSSDDGTAMIFATAIRFQKATARQWTAHVVSQNGRTLEALEILQEAVREAPLDATAAFTLGALQLRQVFFASLENKNSGNSAISAASKSQFKAAQVQLLKAAKLDSTKANPFALLGYWYEANGDNKRAVGCYSKALLLDPTQPVAGRGLLRLTSTTLTDTFQTATLEKALSIGGGGAPLNGWAWLFTGLQKSKLHNHDDLAVVALLKASRARDILQPHSDPLSIFFAPPPCNTACRQEGKSPPQTMATDLIIVLTELAACYRRLGRYTAAIRTYHLAIDHAGENVSSDLLCACGYVELELGLFDESAEKFALAVEKSRMTSTNISAVAAYGHGQALLAMAQQDLHDGKAGAALAHVLLAIDECESSTSTSCCMSKLRGDLHSFAASLPTKLFLRRREERHHVGGGSDTGAEAEDDEEALKCHLDFVARGEVAYLQAKEAVDAPNEEEKNFIVGGFVCDSASNILLEAQLLAQWHAVGTRSVVKPPTSAAVDAFARAADTFRQAIQLSPLYAPAWCGLGCALSASKNYADATMLAQHAFCRAIQLDPLFPDAFANLSFLYTSKNAFAISERVSDSLTQVADSPMMWINRALILERRAAANQPSSSNNVEDQAQQAYDAYRAAVQVVKPQSLVLGLAASGRIAPDVPDWDYKAYCTEYEAVSTGSSLDKELVKVILSTGADRLNEDLNAPVVNDPGNVSISEQAVLEPNRGELWLQLARELVVANDDDNNEDHSGDSISAAETAACRAASLFMLQLTEPTWSASVDVDHRCPASAVAAKDISQALTLVHLLDSSLPKHEVTVNDSDGTQQAASPRPSVDLQRALLMNPHNRLAREAIRQS